jgi:type I restriction enzyme S subunit
MSREGWKTYKLEDIAVFHDSKRVPLNSREREARKGPYPYYGASGVVDYIDDYRFDGEYVLISEDGENLRSRSTPIAFKASGKFWVNNHAHVVKGNEPFLDDWIVYYLQNMDVNPYITGAVQPKLNRENLQLIDIALPDFEKAERIVSVLSALDEKTELNRQTNATLEAIAQTIFKEWFVDFNFPGATGEMQDSELGSIPKGWKAGRYLQYYNGTVTTGESYNEIGEGIPFFQGRADFSFRFPTKRAFTTEPKRYAKKFDTLVSVRAPAGDPSSSRYPSKLASAGTVVLSWCSLTHIFGSIVPGSKRTDVALSAL